uniref:Uncharacterized protein n=1 Tax=Avena sativa TaxID=4498 RepID=A0ACD5ZFH3_AVESA
MAKLNKLRQAYFKSAKLARDAEAEAILLTEIFRVQGKEVLPRDAYEIDDHTVKMPGTEFMEKISVLLEYYIRTRLNTHPRWKDIKVILSDANVPGEAEHKIMSFIRAQRSMENYNPNTCHCVYGHDADLIMLALASHEVHISILREVDNPYRRIPARHYQFVDMWVLREYLELEMKTPDCKQDTERLIDDFCKQDTERLIDDFIFICFFMGNDFIPRIPSLEIYEVCMCVCLTCFVAIVSLIYVQCHSLELIFSLKCTEQPSTKWGAILSTQTKYLENFRLLFSSMIIH